MADLMETLYEYAEDYIMRGLLDREPEYSSVCHYADRKEQTVCELLGGENRQHLEDLLEERRLMAFYEGRALFCAGFQMAVELMR